MRILTNVSKSELDHLTSQPTAKALIEKVETEGIYIPEGDVKAAAEFLAMRESRKQDTLDISGEGRASLEKELKEKERSSQEEQIKKKNAELQKQLAEIRNGQTVSDSDDAGQSKKANAIMQQISMLGMQLAQVQKAKSESDI